MAIEALTLCYLREMNSESHFPHPKWHRIWESQKKFGNICSRSRFRSTQQSRESHCVSPSEWMASQVANAA